MAPIKFRARLQHMPGPWGMNEPVQGANIRITDKDTGNNDDLILEATTNAQGKFRKTSREWRDNTSIPYWEPFPLPGRWKRKRMPDPKDILLLFINIRQGSESITAPYGFLGEDVEIPIVVPWGPGGWRPDDSPPTFSVNDESCSDEGDLLSKILAQVDKKARKISVKISGPAALPLAPLAGLNAAGALDFLEDAIPGVKPVIRALNSSSFGREPVSVGIILALAFLIIGSVMATSMGLALIIAIFKGYKADVKFSTVSLGPIPVPQIELTLIPG